ncbi:MAG: hypothetical protein JNM93_13215 [Bacteriovoracaceae bacterium]|nr:hypothetical protein [Bacteriovoracaceae bacterium]
MSQNDAPEKGFNDEELKDIMDEIENLEKEFAEDAPETSPVSHTSSSDVDMEVEKAMVEEPVAKPNRVHPFKKHSGSGSKLHFRVEGEMHVELSFEIAGRMVQLFVDPVAGLTIEMEDGAKFCLPVDKKAA